MDRLRARRTLRVQGGRGWLLHPPMVALPCAGKLLVPSGEKQQRPAVVRARGEQHLPAYLRPQRRQCRDAAPGAGPGFVDEEAAAARPEGARLPRLPGAAVRDGAQVPLRGPARQQGVQPPGQQGVQPQQGVWPPPAQQGVFHRASQGAGTRAHARGLPQEPRGAAADASLEGGGRGGAEASGEDCGGRKRGLVDDQERVGVAARGGGGGGRHRGGGDRRPHGGPLRRLRHAAGQCWRLRPAARAGPRWLSRGLLRLRVRPTNLTFLLAASSQTWRGSSAEFVPGE
mmetsp:Transcript_57928/g.170033  ORF Transcript_57928/g.170033 Transcript_57928/m.170033 type:complete len:286 (+) Transcript_57928:1854-2711(+)